ncbi:unnamed protein product [Amoebophrya sp. A25]|nr:unnamed protein product [Amoebophrya sp. A25]|eukprot:GSA25T00002570001.1
MELRVAETYSEPPMMYVAWDYAAHLILPLWSCGFLFLCAPQFQSKIFVALMCYALFMYFSQKWLHLTQSKATYIHTSSLSVVCFYLWSCIVGLLGACVAWWQQRYRRLQTLAVGEAVLKEIGDEAETERITRRRLSREGRPESTSSSGGNSQPNPSPSAPSPSQSSSLTSASQSSSSMSSSSASSRQAKSIRLSAKRVSRLRNTLNHILGGTSEDDVWSVLGNMGDEGRSFFSKILGYEGPGLGLKEGTSEEDFFPSTAGQGEDLGTQQSSGRTRSARSGVAHGHSAENDSTYYLEDGSLAPSSRDTPAASSSDVPLRPPRWWNAAVSSAAMLYGGGPLTPSTARRGLLLSATRASVSSLLELEGVSNNGEDEGHKLLVADLSEQDTMNRGSATSVSTSADVEAESSSWPEGVGSDERNRPRRRWLEGDGGGDNTRSYNDNKFDVENMLQEDLVVDFPLIDSIVKQVNYSLKHDYEFDSIVVNCIIVGFVSAAAYLLGLIIVAPGVNRSSSSKTAGGAAGGEESNWKAGLWACICFPCSCFSCLCSCCFNCFCCCCSLQPNGTGDRNSRSGGGGTTQPQVPTLSDAPRILEKNQQPDYQGSSSAMTRETLINLEQEHKFKRSLRSSTTGDFYLNYISVDHHHDEGEGAYDEMPMTYSEVEKRFGATYQNTNPIMVLRSNFLPPASLTDLGGRGGGAMEVTQQPSTHSSSSKLAQEQGKKDPRQTAKNLLDTTMADFAASASSSNLPVQKRASFALHQASSEGEGAPGNQLFPPATGEGEDLLDGMVEQSVTITPDMDALTKLDHSQSVSRKYSRIVRRAPPGAGNILASMSPLGMSTSGNISRSLFASKNSLAPFQGLGNSNMDLQAGNRATVADRGSVPSAPGDFSKTPSFDRSEFEHHSHHHHSYHHHPSTYHAHPPAYDSQAKLVLFAIGKQYLLPNFDKSFDLASGYQDMFDQFEDLLDEGFENINNLNRGAQDLLRNQFDHGVRQGKTLANALFQPFSRLDAGASTPSSSSNALVDVGDEPKGKLSN